VHLKIHVYLKLTSTAHYMYFNNLPLKSSAPKLRQPCLTGLSS